eukprot:maker-scaffold3429_size8701-snap-gene-0.2 protein:Tk12384 transcript:maker-scaffold3429_size8701-snap-gene-0.2-mRNA-1 annotation:"hypothetical protein DAPPUDRAFT_225274"
MDTEETIYWLSEGGCGRTIESEGNLDYTINYLVNEVYPEVAAFLASEYSVGITSDRERTMVVGYSDGGLAACYAAWTRSEIFGGAACQSASFWYPFSWTPGQLPQVDFFFINDTLRLKSPTVMDNRNGRYAQNIFIDVGGAEDESVYKGPMLRQLAVARNKFVNAIVMFSRSTELFWLFRLILGLLVTISILEICLTLLTGHGLIILRDQAPASRLRSAYSGRPLHPDGSADFSKVAESVLHGRHSSKDDSFFRGEFRHFTRRASGDRDGQHPGVFCGEHDQDCLGWLNRWSNWRQ